MLSAMKISHAIDGDRITVRIREEIDGSACDCLEHFWDRFVSDPFSEVRVEMGGVDAIDSQGVAQMVTLLRRNLAEGACLVLDAPPQVLAHTLYKVGLLEPGQRVALLNARSEEPYAG